MERGRERKGADEVNRLPFVLAEQRRGWSLMIFCARATRDLRRPSLDARSEGQSGHPAEDVTGRARKGIVRPKDEMYDCKTCLNACMTLNA